MSAEVKPREWWLVRNPTSNAYSVHEEKPSWDSIMLGNERIHVIEKSYVDKECISRFLHEQRMDAVVKELKLTCDYKRMAEQKLLEVVKERDALSERNVRNIENGVALLKERDALSEWNKLLQRELDGRTKALQDILKARDALVAQLAEAKGLLYATEESSANEHAKVERLEVQVAEAKARICDSCFNFADERDKRLVRLERALAYAKERLEHFAPNKNAYQSCLDIILKLEREE